MVPPAEGKRRGPHSQLRINGRHGKRQNVWPIIGGRFEGQGIKGKVIAGGGDFPVIRPDGAVQIDALYRLRTDDGVTIIVHNKGLMNPPGKTGEGHYRLAPEFIAPVGPYQWLNSHLFIANLVEVPESMRLATGAHESDRLIQVYEVL